MWALPFFGTAAPLFSPASPTEMLRYTLAETPAQLHRLLGDPKVVADQGAFRSLQYQIDAHDPHDFSHVVLVARDSGRLLSITRNYEEPRRIDALFPAAETVTREFRSPGADRSQYFARVRPLAGGSRLLIAMGVSQPGEPTSQLVVIRREAVPEFFPWLEPLPAPPPAKIKR